MKPELSFILILVVATAVALAVRRFRMPYTLALVIAGLAIGSTRLIPTPRLTKELLYALCLPGLIFEAALHLKAKDFLRNKLTILGLAVPGLVAAVALTGAALAALLNAVGFAEGLQLPAALVFAALIAATDPIAVVALFKSLGAPKRLGVLVEGESLVNDGTAIVVFAILHGYATGAPTSAAGVAITALSTVGGGLAIGGAIGFVSAKVMKTVDEPMIEITLTTIAAYGSFALAEQFHFSGVIATVLAGMITGSYAMHVSMKPATRIAVSSFWAYVAFALNSIVFLLIGFEVDLMSLVRDWRAILLAWVIVVIARAAVVLASHVLLSRTSERAPLAWSLVVIWGGLRGALSMVLVLGLSLDFPHRDLLVHLTFGVVLLSLLVQGLTMAPVLKALKVSRVVSAIEGQYELRRGRLVVAQARLDAIAGLAKGGKLHVDLVRELTATSEREVAAAEAAVRDLHLDNEELRAEERQAAERQLLIVQKSALLDAHQTGVVSEEAFASLRSEIDAAIDAVDHPDDHRPPKSAAPTAEARSDAPSGSE
ncbi:MAG: cation:proton antiporter [Polyangiaceae bacterium]